MTTRAPAVLKKLCYHMNMNMGTGYMALWGFRAKCKRVNNVNGLKTVKGGQDEREEKFE